MNEEKSTQEQNDKVIDSNEVEELPIQGEEVPEEDVKEILDEKKYKLEDWTKILSEDDKKVVTAFIQGRHSKMDWKGAIKEIKEAFTELELLPWIERTQKTTYKWDFAGLIVTAVVALLISGGMFWLTSINIISAEQFSIIITFIVSYVLFKTEQSRPRQISDR